jgi:hypothetical protein
MNKKLLSLIFLVLFLTTTFTHAQTKVWDFGGSDTTYWGLDATGVADNEVRDNFGIYMGTTSTSNIGIIDSSNGSVSNWSTAGDTAGYSSTTRFKFNGDSGIVDLGGGALQPTKRYVYFAVTGPCTVKIWLRGTAGRNLYMSGDSYIPFSTVNIPASGYVISTGNYTGNAGNIYLYDDAAVYLVKVEINPESALGTTAVLGTNSIDAVTTNLNANGDKIFVSNVESKTEVNIYSFTGALVKSVSTEIDTDFNITPGLYIAQIKTDKGQKVVKLITY